MENVKSEQFADVSQNKTFAERCETGVRVMGHLSFPLSLAPELFRT